MGIDRSMAIVVPLAGAMTYGKRAIPRARPCPEQIPGKRRSTS
jgi:hypothetical protein